MARSNRLETTQSAYPQPVHRLVLVVFVVLVNLPAVHDAWTGHRIAAEGRDVDAVVLAARTIDDHHLVDYRLPEDVDPARRRFSASLDASAYERARTSHRLAVRVVPGDPGANRPAGETSSPVLLAAAVGADAIVLLVLGLWWWRRRHPAELGG